MRTERSLTAEDVRQLPKPATGHYELVAEELIEAPGAGALRGPIACSAISSPSVTWAWCSATTPPILSTATRIGCASPMSRLSPGSAPEGEAPEGYWTVASTLAVEIASPHERVEDTEARVRDWVAAGTRLAWTLWPQRQVVTVDAPGEAVREFGPEDELDDGAPLPDIPRAWPRCSQFAAGADAPSHQLPSPRFRPTAAVDTIVVPS
jgi:hypothetical protein